MKGAEKYKLRGNSCLARGHLSRPETSPINRWEFGMGQKGVKNKRVVLQGKGG